MATYKKILLATDLSASADLAKSWAMMLARASKSELHVLHVNVLSALHMRYRGLAAADEYARTLVEACKKTLAEIPDEEGVRIQRAVRTDESPGNAIVRYAEDEGIDLIVVGTDGLGAMKRMLIGSVANKVLHSAKVPVLVAGRADSDDEDVVVAPPPPAALRRIVAATDLSEHSRESVRHAAALAAEHGAGLTVVHVMVPLMNDPYTIEPLAKATDPELGNRHLADFLAALSLPVAAEREVVVGAAHEEIVGAAARVDADLLVVAAYGQSAIQRLLFGSVADKVVRTADRPVLVHRAPRS